MAKEILTRAVTRLYKEKAMLNEDGTIGIETLLFNTPDDDISAAFSLDKLISNPYGIAYRNSSNQSVIRHYEPGTNLMVTVPRASEKTPIDEVLRDTVAAGHEATDSQLEQMAANVMNIVEGHAEGHNMTKARQALDVYRTGIFVARGVLGGDLGLDYDFGREAGGSITYDFTAGGANMNEAILQIQQRLDSRNTPKQNRFAILGQDWQSEFGNDSGIIEYMKANAANQIIEQRMFAERFGNVNGLYVIAHYKPVGSTSDIWLLSYDPGVEYVQYKGATPEPFVPDDEVLAGSLNDRSYNVKRGVDVYDENGKVARVVGDLAVDSFTEKDPITTLVRAQARHFYVMGNINHTVKSVGTF